MSEEVIDYWNCGCCGELFCLDVNDDEIDKKYSVCIKCIEATKIQCHRCGTNATNVIISKNKCHVCDKDICINCIEKCSSCLKYVSRSCGRGEDEINYRGFYCNNCEMPDF